MDEGGQKNSGNGTTALAKLLNQLNVPTLLAVMLFGGGNFLATKEDGRLTRDEQVKVVGEVHDLHNALEQFEARQKQSLDNQAQILRSQTEILQILQEGQRQFLNRQQKLFQQHPEGQ